jgi:hypothetical protein
MISDRDAGEARRPSPGIVGTPFTAKKASTALLIKNTKYGMPPSRYAAFLLIDLNFK